MLVITILSHNEIAIMSAAVSDYTPKVVSKNKIKKNTESLNIEFIKTQDILKILGDIKSRNKCLSVLH